MKKIVVTGGLGFIGSNLINLLHKKGFFVINLDKKQYYSSDYNIINKKKHNYKFFKVDTKVSTLNSSSLINFEQKLS